MRTVLIGTDFMYDNDGNLKPIEINTNTGWDYISKVEDNNDSLDLTNFPNLEFRPLYRLIFKTATAYANTPKAYIVQVDDFRFSTVIPQGGITLSTNTIYDADSNVTITDTGTGQIDFTVDGTAVMQLKASGLTAYRETVYAGGNTSTAITPSYVNGNIQTFTANNDFTLNLPTGMSAGQNLVLIIAQDATGTRLMTANSSLKFSNANKTLSITASAIDVISIFYDGSRYLCSLSRGFA
jgi:hypothetical protein